jgi:periplasmic divalent cation tolerance protein
MTDDAHGGNSTPIDVESTAVKRLSQGADDPVVVLTTGPDDDRPEAWGRALVDERLAACVNVLAPMTSLYRWKERLERDAERQMIIKTTRARLDGVLARLRELHSYELPEFLVLAVDSATDEYAEWLRK